MSVLRTARLRLEPWAPEHVEPLARWGADPAVVRFVGDGTTWPRERAQERSAAQLEHWREHGFGWRIAYERDGRDPVALLALNFAPEGTDGMITVEHEIGWWVAPEAWGRGYAREGAAAVRDEALARLGAPWVVARIHPDNAASIRVAEAIGLRHEQSTTGPAGPVELYRSAPVRP